MENILEATDELQNWEVILPCNSCLNSGDSSDDIRSGPFIQPGLSSFEVPNPSCLEDFADDRSADSGNRGRIDPGSGGNPVRYLYKESGEFLLDSSSAMSEDLRTYDSVGRNGCSLSEKQVGSEGVGELGDGTEEKMEDLDNSCSQSALVEIVPEKFDDPLENSAVGMEGNSSLRSEVDDSAEEKLENDSIGRETRGIRKSGVIWWKMPIEFLKFCLMRMSPVWSVSVAAAVLGFVILGRRLYRMKSKPKILEIRVAFDDKKASQVMSSAARLSKSFSTVKHVPVIRSSLHAGGVTTWPAMSLR